jgi:hypothetical protein
MTPSDLPVRQTDGNKIFAHAAHRARSHPAYLGWILRQYKELENRSEDDIAQFLGIAALDLRRLSLCLRPRTDHFAEDVRQIGEKFQVEATTLAGIIRLVESVEAMAAAPEDTVSPESGLLMAARARKKPQRHRGKQRNGDKQPKP